MIFVNLFNSCQLILPRKIFKHPTAIKNKNAIFCPFFFSFCEESATLLCEKFHQSNSLLTRRNYNLLEITLCQADV